VQAVELLVLIDAWHIDLLLSGKSRCDPQLSSFGEVSGEKET
jgi:hypothetical protein